MEFVLFIVFVFTLASTVLGVKFFVYGPFIRGDRQVNRLKHPTLARTQRILRARNTKAREKEQKSLAFERNRRYQEALAALSKENHQRITDSRNHHAELITFWDGMFSQAMAREVAEKLDESEKRRARVLGMWTVVEKQRIKKFREEKEAEDLRLRAARDIEKRELESHYARLQTSDGWGPLTTGSYGDRMVTVHAVSLRRLPSTGTRKVGGLVQGQRASIDGWIESEDLYGNNIWFRLKPSSVHPAGWIWSGAFHNTSTSGLANLNEDTDEYRIVSVDRSVDYTIRMQSTLQQMIEETAKRRCKI